MASLSGVEQPNVIDALFFVINPVEEMSMDKLAKDNKIARSMGLSYGMYKAMLYQKERQFEKSEIPCDKKSRRTYSDEEAFALWQQGKNDSEIGASLGVSRQAIQKWRDVMELPATAKRDIDTNKYQLIKTKRGTFVINREDL